MDGSKVDWFVYLGHPKLQYPTYSPSIIQEQFRLESNTESFITFSLEQETVLKYRGIFQNRKYCVEKTSQEAVKCYKECFIKSLKVFCFEFKNFPSLTLFSRYPVCLLQLTLLMSWTWQLAMKLRRKLSWTYCSTARPGLLSSNATVWIRALSINISFM